MARIIWDKPGNPPKYVSDRLRIHHWQLGDAIHELKASGNVSPAERVIIHDDARPRMRLVMSSGTSTTKSDDQIRAFATLRFAGDALDPDEISRVVKEQPTKAYRKGQIYRSGPHGPDVTGRTGVWYFSTKRKTMSKDLADHFNVLERLVAPFGDQGARLKELHDIMGNKNLQAHVTFFCLFAVCGGLGNA
jgi:hypothetical protein